MESRGRKVEELSSEPVDAPLVLQLVVVCKNLLLYRTLGVSVNAFFVSLVFSVHALLMSSQDQWHLLCRTHAALSWVMSAEPTQSTRNISAYKVKN